MIAIRVSLLLVLLHCTNVCTLHAKWRHFKVKNILKSHHNTGDVEDSAGSRHVPSLFFNRVGHRYEFESTRLWKRRKRDAGSLRKVGDVGVANGKINAKNYSEIKANTDAEGSILYREGPSRAEDANLLERFKSMWPVQSWSRYGLFSEDYLLMVNRHWLQFPPPPRWVSYTMGAVYVGFTVVGCSGNAVVLLMYFRSVLWRKNFFIS
ncbi:hypothetical protein EVAR_35427_1 [Eumeta japonica]|uniref:Uncharacterized protein n=1 Tax=Eumeta variegata TaxID=151549 RepID=A0A4C1X6R8_EUMVA|nr:hypothetical protein EVAR_35427_1 [Eumeta japonica]